MPADAFKRKRPKSPPSPQPTAEGAPIPITPGTAKQRKVKVAELTMTPTTTMTKTSRQSGIPFGQILSQPVPIAASNTEEKNTIVTFSPISLPFDEPSPAVLPYTITESSIEVRMVNATWHPTLFPVVRVVIQPGEIILASVSGSHPSTPGIRVVQTTSLSAVLDPVLGKSTPDDPEVGSAVLCNPTRRHPFNVYFAFIPNYDAPNVDPGVLYKAGVVLHRTSSLRYVWENSTIPTAPLWGANINQTFYFCPATTTANLEVQVQSIPITTSPYQCWLDDFAFMIVEPYRMRFFQKTHMWNAVLRQVVCQNRLSKETAMLSFYTGLSADTISVDGVWQRYLDGVKYFLATAAVVGLAPSRVWFMTNRDTRDNQIQMGNPTLAMQQIEGRSFFSVSRAIEARPGDWESHFRYEPPGDFYNVGCLIESMTLKRNITCSVSVIRSTSSGALALSPRISMWAAVLFSALLIGVCD